MQATDKGCLGVSLALLSGIFFLLFSRSLSAATAPNTQIINLASVDYLTGSKTTTVSSNIAAIDYRGTSANINFLSNSSANTILSNKTVATVQTFHSVAIGPPWSGIEYLGNVFTIRHTVTNHGNDTDTFDIECVDSDSFPARFLAADGKTQLGDSNKNGIPDVGPLAPGESSDIVLEIKIPNTFNPGRVKSISAAAILDSDSTIRASVTDRISIPNFWDPLEKTVEPAGQLTPGAVVTYTNTFGNSGSAAATNIVISDVLDANLDYIDGSALSPAGITGTVVKYDNATRMLTWTIPSIPAGYAGKVSFRTMLHAGSFPEYVVSNQISVVCDQASIAQISNAASTVVVEQPLDIAKSADRKTVEIGDYIGYTVQVKNKSTVLTAENAIISDDLPRGLRYLKGSSQLDGKPFADPSGGIHPQWILGSLGPGESRTLTYRTIVSVDAKIGDAINSAVVSGTTLKGNILRTGPANARVKIEEGILNSKAIILGRVFIDQDGNRMPGEKEPGVQGIRLYLEDGTFAATDKEGKFSIRNVREGEHILKLDRNSLPSGYEPVPLDNTFAGDGGSRFISVGLGGPARGDFGLVRISGDAAADPEKKDKPPKRVLTFNTASPASTAPLEVQVQYMDPTPEILSPKNGETLSKPWADIAVRVPEEASHILKVNGTGIPHEKIGETIHESARKLFVYKYIGVNLASGNNSIALESTTPGKETVRKEISLPVSGQPAKIVLELPKAAVAADGKSTASLAISLLDEWNRPSLEEAVVTIIVTKGDIVEPDLDPSSAGHQIKVLNGRAVVSLRSKFETGNGKILVQLGRDMQAEAEVYFTPELRNWIVAGIGRMAIGAQYVKDGRANGNENSPVKEILVRERDFAIFVKGKLFDNYLLTGAYDSGKPKSDMLFQRSAPGRFYPIYGDASQAGYDAESQRKLYLKIEQGKSSVLFGDYHADLSKNEFTRYDRVLNGIKTDIDTGVLTFRGFAAKTDQELVKDEIAANGTSGFYTLSKNPILENSEKVRVEVRDRYHSERILSSVDKAPYADYSIDYANGALMFKEPVFSLDPAFNPVFIVVTYEARSGGYGQYVYGGRAGVRFGKKLEFGATGIVEEKGLGNNTLFGADANLKLFGGMRFNGEAATSQTLERGRGNAWSLKLEKDAGSKLKFNAYYRNVDDTFRNPSMTGNETGITKYGAGALYRPFKGASVIAESFVQKEKDSPAKQFVNTLGITQSFSRLKLEGGYNFVTQEPSDARQKGTDSEIVYAGISTAITKKLGASIRRDQVISEDSVRNYPTKTSGELSYHLFDNLVARLTQEIQEGGDKRNITALRFESRITKNASLSSRYQIEDTISGESAQAVFGLNNKWVIAKSVALNMALERIQLVSGKSGGSEGTAISLSEEFFGNKNIKAAARYEVQLRKLETTQLFDLGAAVKISNGISLLPKVRLWHSDKQGGEHSLHDGVIGFAYRPLGSPSIYLLSSLRFKLEKTASAAGIDERKNAVSSTELTYKILPRLSLTGKYAGKFSWESARNTSFNSYTDLMLAGLAFDITGSWELEVSGKRMNQYKTSVGSLGMTAKTGYRIYRNLYAVWGYNLSRVNDKELSGSDYKSHGPFFELKFKFDEKTLGL